MAEAGLNVENEFADLDGATQTRMAREANAVAEARQQGGRTAMDMLGGDVAGTDVSGEMTHG